MLMVRKALGRLTAVDFPKVKATARGSGGCFSASGLSRDRSTELRSSVVWLSARFLPMKRPNYIGQRSSVEQ